MEPDRTAALQVFQSEGPRSHAGWATAGVLTWWAGFFLLSGVISVGSVSTGVMMVLPTILWMFGGSVGVPYAARRVDEALGRNRGDHRALRRPGLTALGAFAGTVAATVALFVALDALHARLGDGGAWALLPTAIVGAWLGARLVAGRDDTRVVSIGCDAVSARDGGKTVIVALRDIAEVRHTADRAEVLRRDGTSVTIDLRGLSWETGAAIERAAQAAQTSLAAGASLRRDDRPLAAWREALHAKVMGGTGFRAQALDRDDLEASLVHPGTSAEERIGAALALRDLDDAGATRVRIVAESVVTPALRDVLRAVADDAADDDALRKASRA